MRRALRAWLAVAACALAPLAHGWEIEAERHFAASAGGPGGRELHVLSTTDLDFFAPLVLAFQAEHPDVAVRYTVASSRSVFDAVVADPAIADVVVSSAVDLQVKLVNDGYARPHRSAASAALPARARWRDELFAFTREPASLLISRRAFEGLDPPIDREALIALLRAHPERFRGRIGTYDIEASGVGYLFATQDARSSDAWWRLVETMGELDARLYCCSAGMIEDLARGRLALAYNVVGGYADASLATSDDIAVVPLSDFTHVLQRTALIPERAARPALAGDFVDFLIGPVARRTLVELIGVPPIGRPELAGTPRYRPVRLGPGVLVYLDAMKRRRFLTAWRAAMRPAGK